MELPYLTQNQLDQINLIVRREMMALEIDLEEMNELFGKNWCPAQDWFHKRKLGYYSMDLGVITPLEVVVQCPRRSARCDDD